MIRKIESLLIPGSNQRYVMNIIRSTWNSEKEGRGTEGEREGKLIFRLSLSPSFSRSHVSLYPFHVEHPSLAFT